jgi:hypothetical protein
MMSEKHNATYHGEYPSDAAIVDQWWTSCEDVWAIPEELMIRFARDVLREWGGRR